MATTISASEAFHWTVAILTNTTAAVTPESAKHIFTQSELLCTDTNKESISRLYLPTVVSTKWFWF